MKKEISFVKTTYNDDIVYKVFSNFVNNEKQEPMYIGKILINVNVNRYAFYPTVIAGYGESCLTKIVKFLEELNKDKGE